eukprot:Pgem_evm1s3493
MKHIKQKWYGKSNSDLLILLNAVGAYEFAVANGGGDGVFCEKNYLREKAMKEVRKLRWQLTNIISSVAQIDCIINPKLKPPSKAQEMLLWKGFLSAFGDQIAKRFRLKSGSDHQIRQHKRAYQGLNSDEILFIHQSSALYHSLPEW